jgi:ankyrin repeat protein
MTPLHSAAYHGNVEIVKLLIDAGANINAAVTRYGFTPWAHAARKGHVDVIGLLLDAGANREIAVKDGRTPIAVARQYGKLEAANALMSYQPATSVAR